jgi:nitrite reductase (NADH) small subunit
MTTNPPDTSTVTSPAISAASSQAPQAAWTAVCALDDILPDTGICARVQGRHVAVFRLADGALYAIDNVDPKSGASVLSRGLVGNLGDVTVVASPLYKNHFNLATGACLELPECSVTAHAVRCDGGQVLVALN